MLFEPPRQDCTDVSEIKIWHTFFFGKEELQNHGASHGDIEICEIISISLAIKDGCSFLFFVSKKKDYLSLSLP